MNQRIRELVKQAGGHFSTHNLMSNPVQHRESVELWDDKIEKFAELLIQECLHKIENEAAQYAEPVWAFELVNDIKEHFGVE